MVKILYDIVVSPLVYIVELSFSILLRVLNNPGLALVGVSLVVNSLCLPLYRMADLTQKAEHEKQESMEKWVKHIKEHFHGDEQYMMLTTYYRQRGYKPLSALKGSASLLLQIPVFMAAYNYISNLTLLKGAPFLFISDLGAPDQLLIVDGFTVNVLPIAMTLLNCVSTFIYTRELALRDKIQTYCLALVFLALLYNSPSGLVLYWTCNQIFSFVKNIFLKILEKPRKALCFLIQVVLIAFGSYLFVLNRVTSVCQIVTFASLVCIVELIVIIPLVRECKGIVAGGEDQSNYVSAFLFSAFLLAALVGLLIPSALLADSTAEFIDVYDYVSPLTFLFHTGAVSVGLFVLWVGVYFLLSNSKGKNSIGLGMAILAGISVLDYFCFPDALGTIASDLIYSVEPVFEAQAILNNAIAVLGLSAVIVALWHFKRSVVTPLLGIILTAVICLSIMNISVIAEVSAEKEREAVEIANSTHVRMFDDNGNPLPIFNLSSEGHNVVVIFMDRAIGGYIPYLFNERPDLVDKFDGFTYYPNTISFGPRTVFGAPALYGGYDYSFEAINERENESLVTKHMEALSIMPRIFHENGFMVTVLDPPLVDYSFGATEYTNLEAMIPGATVLHVSGAYNGLYLVGGSDAKSCGIANERTFFFYSLFKAVPTLFRPMVYDGGTYYSTTTDDQNVSFEVAQSHDLANAEASSRRPTFTLKKEFFDNYTVLASLSFITGVVGDSSNNFIILQNSTTHTPSLLQLPDYVPSIYLNNEGLEDYDRFTINGRTVDMSSDMMLAHYHSNMATLLLLSDWFDFMREHGVYNNTRIVIVADHGYELHQWEDLIFDDSLDIEMLNPLLMVKDFESHGFMTSDEFMTNGDVPAIVFEGLVENPVNPYTGNPINSDEKNAKPQQVTTSVRWDVRDYQTGNTFNTEDGHTYTVHDNIFDFNNWERLD